MGLLKQPSSNKLSATINTMPNSKKSYQELKTELDAVMQWFESDELDVDEALEKYEQGRALIVELEAYLKTAENKVTKVKQLFGDK